LHLDDVSTLNHGALNGVNHDSSSSTKEAIASNRRMKMNCFDVPARLVLYFLSWSGFLVSFMMRNDINFALVVMVKTRNETQAAQIGNSSDNVTDLPTHVNCTCLNHLWMISLHNY
jgi:hypothetical protein